MRKIVRNMGAVLVIMICAIGIFCCMVEAVPESGIRMYVYLFFSAIFAIMVPGLLLWFLSYTEYLENKIDMLINEDSYDMIKEKHRGNL